ncbi:hypothetical protein BaRGS_00031091 [Batillaria attramentaria]|uniref:Uncharacterized protein n=1 Tax=Batillaria attramentaria TaxID=370345 RepID=A0ABD0JSY8_9CAEN
MARTTARLLSRCSDDVSRGCVENPDASSTFISESHERGARQAKRTNRRAEVYQSAREACGNQDNFRNSDIPLKGSHFVGIFEPAVDIWKSSSAPGQKATHLLSKGGAVTPSCTCLLCTVFQRVCRSCGTRLWWVSGSLDAPGRTQGPATLLIRHSILCFPRKRLSFERRAPTFMPLSSRRIEAFKATSWFFDRVHGFCAPSWINLLCEVNEVEVIDENQ